MMKFLLLLTSEKKLNIVFILVPTFQYLIFVILDRVDSISDIRLLFVVANFHFFAFPVLNDVLASDLRDGQAFVGQEEVFVILAADVTNHFGVRVVTWGIFNALENCVSIRIRVKTLGNFTLAQFGTQDVTILCM